MPTIAALKYVLIALLLAGIAAVIHANGRSIERGVWLAKENKSLADTQRALDAANKKARELAAQNMKLNSEVQSNAAKELEKIITADSAMRRDPRGLRIPAEVCRAVPVPRPAPRAEIDNRAGFDGWVRLPERIENDLYEYAIKANITRIRRDECRAFALGLQAQREEWERAQGEK